VERYVLDTKTDVLMINIEFGSIYCNNVCSAACGNACNSLEAEQNRTTVHIPDTQTIEKITTRGPTTLLAPIIRVK